MRDTRIKLTFIHRLAIAAGSLVFTLTLIGSAPAEVHAGSGPTVGDDAQALGAATSLSAAGILTGWDAAGGVPQKYVTRGELAIMLARALGLKDATVAHFSDVPRSMDCYGAVGALHEAALLRGESETTFVPDGVISRQRAALWITDGLAYKVPRQEPA
jgi:hypothetical protein